MVLPDATKQMVLDTLIEVFGQEKVDSFPPPLMAMMQEFYLAAFRDGGNYRAKQLQAAMGNQGTYEQGYQRGINDSAQRGYGAPTAPEWHEEEQRRREQLFEKEAAYRHLKDKDGGYGPNHR